MKLLGRLLLCAALLMQGAMAVAMPLPAAQAPNAMARPCHDDGAKAPASCCTGSADCLAMCAAPAVPAQFVALTPTFPRLPAAELRAGESLPAHAFVPIRPPIALHG